MYERGGGGTTASRPPPNVRPARRSSQYFEVSDPDPADVLTLTASSSNQSVVADAGLVFSGTGGSRTLAISPVANASGSTTITVTVDDGTPPAVSTTFDVIVNPLNDAPVFTSAPVLTATEDQPYTYAVTVTDAAGNLVAKALTTYAITRITRKPGSRAAEPPKKES